MPDLNPPPKSATLHTAYRLKENGVIDGVAYLSAPTRR
jgi:hypothetical protein